MEKGATVISVVKGRLIPGVLAGLAGGLVFAAAMWHLGLLPRVALLVGGTSAVVGFIIHMLIAAVVGAGFGLLVQQQRPGAGETFFWGLNYGLLWWVLGSLTLLPLLLGQPLAWDLHAAQENFPTLPGYLLYGAVTGLTLALLRRGDGDRPSWQGPLLRGIVAGLLAAWLLGVLLDTQDQLLPMSAMMAEMAGSRLFAWLITLFIGLVAGVVFAWLYPAPFDGAGAGMVRGGIYGFFWWLLGAYTVMPLLHGSSLPWSLAAVQADFETFPAYILFGTAVALFYQWLHRLARLLFADDIGDPTVEGVGTRGLRALGRGAAGGLIGGLIFTVVMAQIGFLPVVASLVGSASPFTGFVVHLVIANLIGMSYGLLFHRQAYDMGSALGWGVSYGFIWWVLGPLTLMPVLLGGLPQWHLTAVADTFPALIGHLAYGAGLGITFYLLEARYRPWWVSRTKAEAARIAQRKAQIHTSAPALWVLVVVIALTLPVLLGM